MSAPVTGHADPAFAPVRDLFASSLADGAESGASLAVTVGGALVVDLRGGWRDTAGTLPWQPDTLVTTYSVAKPFAAMCLLMLVDRGLAGLDDPVARHWPGFRGAGVTLRHVLAHTAGYPAFPVERGTDAIGDWDALAADLAAADPMWTPGAFAAEQALTYGHLVGELVRRIDGRDVGRFTAQEIAGPWGLDLGFGLSPADQARCADLRYAAPDWPLTTLGEPGSLRDRGLNNPAGCLDLDVLNSPLWRGSLLPAVNMHATAVAVARFYAGLLAGGELDGVRLLSPEAAAELTRVQYDGPDLLLERPVRWGLGVQVEDDGSWGMGGIGGNCGFADPVRGYTFGYLTSHLGDFERVDTLVDTLNASL